MTDRNTRLEQLHQALKERIVILDGGMGTMPGKSDRLIAYSL